MIRRLARDDHDAAARRFATAQRSTELDRLAGDHRRGRVADVHRVGVHDPRHDLLVGVHVGRRDVLLGSDRVDDLRDVAACERFDLALRHLRRIANHAALAAAEWNVRDGALPRHPRRERRHFVERDAGMIANASLRRSERDVVLHAIAGEDLDLAVVHLHRARDDDLAFGVGEDLPDARFEIEKVRRSVEFLEHRAEDRTVSFHDAPVAQPKRASLAWPASASQPASRLLRDHDVVEDAVGCRRRVVARHRETDEHRRRHRDRRAAERRPRHAVLRPSAGEDVAGAYEADPARRGAWNDRDARARSAGETAILHCRALAAVAADTHTRENVRSVAR